MIGGDHMLNDYKTTNVGFISMPSIYQSFSDLFLLEF